MLIQILKSEDGKTATMDLIGEFGGWLGSDESFFAKQFRALDQEAAITINLNSQGGDLFQALCIRNLLSQHQGTITCNVLGWAASAATLVTSLPNVHTRMLPGSFLMIHNPKRFLIGGNQHDLRKAAQTLELLAGEMARLYADKSGMEINEVQRLMDAETWFTAEEAVEKGLADELSTSAKVVASVNHETKTVSLGGVALSGGSLPQSFFEEQNEMTVKNQAASPEAAAQAPEGAAVNQPQAQAAIETAIQLQAAYPGLVKELQDQAVASALSAERERMKALDAIRDRSPSMVDKAKYETHADAAATALEILKQDTQTVQDHAAAVAKDATTVADALKGVDSASAPDAGTLSDGVGSEAAALAWVEAFAEDQKEGRA